MIYHQNYQNKRPLKSILLLLSHMNNIHQIDFSTLKTNKNYLLIITSVIDVKRYDPLGPAHKGIRYAMNSMQFRAGNMNYDDDMDLMMFAHELDLLWRLLHAHGDGEDKFLFPLIEKVDKKIFDELEDEHEAFEPLMKQLEEEIKLIAKMENGTRAEQGHRYTVNYNAFLADYFVHVQNEETMGQVVLSEHYEDKLLMEAVAKFPSVTPPDVTSYFAKYLIPALNFEERVAFIWNIKINAPPAAYKLFKDIAINVLPEADWVKLKKAIE